MKLLTLAATLVLGLVVAPTVTAQSASPSGQTPRKHALQRTVRQDLVRIRRGTRAGQITAGERRLLGAQLRALRGQIRSIRQAGAPASPDQRAALRAELRRLNRTIIVARHNKRVRAIK